MCLGVEVFSQYLNTKFPIVWHLHLPLHLLYHPPPLWASPPLYLRSPLSIFEALPLEGMSLKGTN